MSIARWLGVDDPQVSGLTAGLEDLGIGAGDRVLLHLPRSLDWVRAAQACWRRGASIVPIDPAWPPARREAIAHRAKASACFGGGLGLPVPVPTDRIATDIPFDLDRDAWLIFTSGTTGHPKGVRVSFRGVPALLRAQVDAFGLTEADRVGWALSPGFDASLSDVLTALHSGATLVPAPPGLLRSPDATLQWLAEERITCIDLPPSLLPHLDLERLPPTLRTVVVGGEPLSPVLARRWAERVDLIVVYGPTEATICTHLARVAQDWDAPHIGHPIEGVEQRIVEGELQLSGPCMAVGYLDGDGDRFFEEAGRRWYRTGDRVRPGAHGPIFLGRTDRVCKIRGQLVAPEEVERTLRDHPEVHAAAVWVEDARLLATVESEVDVHALRAWAASRLPAWMVPARITTRDRLPTGPTGKLDRAALTDPIARLTHAWSEELGVHLHAHDDLDAHGRDSMSALRVLDRLHREGMQPHPEQLLLARTPADCAASLSTGRATPAELLAELPTPHTAVIGPPAEGPILLLGATGLLGGALYRELAQRGLEVVPLVRARSEEHARARLTHPGRILTGDLTAPCLGLDAAAWSWVREHVSTVLDASGRVHLLAPRKTLWPLHVGGTHALTALAAETPLHLHHIGTLSSFVSREPVSSSIVDGEPLPGAGELLGGYAQSKWAAEALLHRTPNLRFTSHRCGLLVDLSRRTEDQLQRFVRGLARLGAVPTVEGSLPDLAVNLTPVRAAASAIVDAVQRGEVGCPHIVQPTNIRLTDLVAGLTRAGVSLDAIPLTDWLQQCDHEDVRLALSRLTASTAHTDLFLSTGVTWAAPHRLEPWTHPQRARAVDRLVRICLEPP